MEHTGEGESGVAYAMMQPSLSFFSSLTGSSAGGASVLSPYLARISSDLASRSCLVGIGEQCDQSVHGAEVARIMAYKTFETYFRAAERTARFLASVSCAQQGAGVGRDDV